ncbi:MAG: CDP-diacylglycerol--glycerol-3-phosphate 3-phosphatidyltransferase [Myxococcales bacterium]|nr:CDP-diacylglycerol--glycerol-3-phosphate 3-phosphatidyltransferase [Myxococcales bacterium]
MSSRFDRFKREILNLPNMITIGRLFMIPPVLLLIDRSDPFKCLIAMLVFMIASALDIADGWLARRQGLVTVFGKFMDPLADKIMVMALLVYLVADGRVPAWIVVLLLAREFYISGIRLIAVSENVVIAAGPGGKAKTALQLVGICFILVHYQYRMPWVGETTMDFGVVGFVLLLLSIIMSYYSAVEYTVLFGQGMANKRADV